MTTFTYELTDTFGGEANYSWVRRGTFELPSDATDRQIVTAAKRALDITGVRCTTACYGDFQWRLDVVGACVCAFIEIDLYA